VRTKSRATECDDKRSQNFEIPRRQEETSFLPITGHGDTDGSTLSLTSALDGDERPKPRPVRCTPGDTPGAYCTGDSVGPRNGMEKCAKSRCTGIRTPNIAANSEAL
jgi:hypothetical protein